MYNFLEISKTFKVTYSEHMWMAACFPTLGCEKYF